MRSVARIFVVALMAFAAVASADERMLVEGILVRVNDRIITVSDFAARVRTELSQFPEPPSEADARKYVEMLLQEVVNELVLLERAAEKRLTAEEGMVDQAIAKHRQLLAETNKSSDAYRRNYVRFLMQQATGLVRSGDYDTAERLADRASQERVTFGPKHENVRSTP